MIYDGIKITGDEQFQKNVVMVLEFAKKYDLEGYEFINENIREIKSERGSEACFPNDEDWYVRQKCQGFYGHDDSFYYTFVNHVWLQHEIEDYKNFPALASAFVYAAGESYGNETGLSEQSFQQAREICGSELYLFNWNDIQENDTESTNLKKFLKQKYDTYSRKTGEFDWLLEAKIEKIDYGTLKIFSGNNSFFLLLNNKQTKVLLTINNIGSNYFDAKTENSKLNIYSDSCRERVQRVSEPWHPATLFAESFAIKAYTNLSIVNKSERNKFYQESSILQFKKDLNSLDGTLNKKSPIIDIKLKAPKTDLKVKIIFGTSDDEYFTPIMVNLMEYLNKSFKVPKEKMKILNGSEFTYNKFLEALKEYKTFDNETIIIDVNNHGGFGYFMFSDGGRSYREISEAIKKNTNPNAKKIILISACYSGSAIGYDFGNNTAVITASTPISTSGEMSLLDKIIASPHVDYNNDGKIELKELYLSYITWREKRYAIIVPQAINSETGKADTWMPQISDPNNIIDGFIVFE